MLNGMSFLQKCTVIIFGSLAWLINCLSQLRKRIFGGRS